MNSFYRCIKSLSVAGLVCCFISGVQPSFAQETYSWHNVHMGGGGFVSAIITGKTERGLIYARTDVGGAYRLDTLNNRWVPLLDWVSDGETSYLGVEALAIDPQQPRLLYMLAGTSYWNNGKTAILRSNDYGNTFTAIDVSSQFKAHGNGLGRHCGEKLAVDPNSGNILFCGTRENGLYKSIDSGFTWNMVPSLPVTTTPNGNGISWVALDSSTGTVGTATQTIIVGVSRMGSTNLYRSDDGGQNFSPVPGAPETLMPQRAALDADRTLYITYANGAGPHGSGNEPMDAGAIWKYNLQTGVWTNITPAGFTSAFAGISVDPANPQRVVATTINSWILQDNAYGDRIFLSSNGGANWTDVVASGFDLDPDGIPWIDGHSIHWAGSIEFDPFDTKKVWVTSGNGVFRTDNIEASPGVWKFAVQDMEETVPLALESIPNGPLISVIADYDGFLHTDVDEYAPIHQPQMGSTTGLAAAAINNHVVLRAGSNMYYSGNSGQLWTACNKNGNNGFVSVSADGAVFLHCPENSSTTYRSLNNGSSWTTVNGLPFSNARPVADAVNPDKFYAYDPSNGMLYASADAGTTFLPAGTTGTGGSKLIRTVPGYEGHIWVALYGGGLVRSENGGQSFLPVADVSYCAAVGTGKAAPGETYPAIYIWGRINNVTGLYRSVNAGAGWVRINDDAHEFGGPANGQFVSGDRNVFGRVYMSTAGRGIVYGESSESCIPTYISPRMKINDGAFQPVFVATVMQGAAILLSPEVTGSGGSWSWKGPGGFSSSTREISLSGIQANQEGIYVVQYTNDSGCTGSPLSFLLSVTIPTAVPNLVAGVDFELYPTLSRNGHFVISLASASAAPVLVNIYQSQGGRVYGKSFRAGTDRIEVKHTLLPGLYFVRITKGKETGVQKLIVY